MKTQRQTWLWMTSSGGGKFFQGIKTIRQMNTMFVSLEKKKKKIMFVGDEEHVILIDIMLLMFINYWVISIPYPIILRENLRTE